MLAEVLDQTEEERLEWLIENTRDDPTLADDIQKLLRLDHESDSFLGETVSDFLEPIKPLLDDDAADKEFTFSKGTRIGSWRIEKLIGKGGIGQVYLAERDDGIYSKKVALKCIKKGMDSEVILQRFRYERQILASLQHPNIATLYDGGLTADGRPYLVMEYVDGIPIDQYCDKLKLGIRERFKLFQDVCRAVHYAHRNLVVHRDLKPSNILVTGQGTVKLLDFGIAKLLDSKNTGQPLTQTMMPVMTPVYAAPEQIRGETVTTATDVYALGVILYKLMTGNRPYAISSGSSLETIQAVLHQEPDNPSLMVKKRLRQKSERLDARSIEQISIERGLKPERLYQKLRGDIDMIVMKALQKEPDRRYTSAETFLEDINHHLEGLPVTSRADSIAYRMNKLIRRHQFGIATAVVIILLAVFFIGLHTMRITQERNRALTERDKAEEVVSFLETLFDASDPFAEERLDTMQVRNFLNQRVAEVQQGLSNQPLVQAQVLNTAGTIYHKLGLFEQAQSLLEQALHIRGLHLGPNHTDLAESQADLAALYKKIERYDEADSLSQLALTTQRAILGAEHPYVAATLNQRAILLRDISAFEEAESLFEEALTIYRNAYGEDDLHVLSVLNEQAVLANDRGDYAKAEILFRDLINKRRALLGNNHPLVSVSLNNLATVLRSLGRYEDAETPVREALAINRKVFGDVHPHIADNLTTLAALQRRKGDYESAEHLLYEAMDVYRRHYGPQHSILAYSLTNLGEILRDKGDYTGAEQAHRQALILVRENVGERDVGVGIITGFVARVLFEKGDYRAAEPLYREALEHLRQLFPEGHERISGLASGLGATLTQLGRFEEAEPLLLEGYQGLQQIVGDTDERTKRALHALVTLYEKWDNPEKYDKYLILLNGTF